MIHYWHKKSDIKARVYIPKYYDPFLVDDLQSLRDTHDLFVVEQLVSEGAISISTGHEIGKLAYGTGDIPFIRTSDISNWEIKSMPKQGVSEEIYQEYAESQDMQVGDILLVRDGTYLIGTNCIVTELDKKCLYQSHILKIRVNDKAKVDPRILFLALNSDLVQRQIRSFQFTADTIDTIGNRYLELVIPIPKSASKRNELSGRIRTHLDTRERGRAFIKQAPVLMEEVLERGTVEPIQAFMEKDWADILSDMSQNTIVSEFGPFQAFWQRSGSIRERIYLPKYYDPEIVSELAGLGETCNCVSIGDLVNDGLIQCSTGDEIGKMAYGTGEIPFIRTSDFSSWEINHNPKQGVSDEIYEQYADSQDTRSGDIFIVRDGTYLVGTSCIVTEHDAKSLYCGGIYKIRVLDESAISPWLLLGLLNSFIVKRQIRTKQFTRDVIDTLGQRLFEIILPIPKSKEVREQISEQVKEIVLSRIDARQAISKLADELIEG